MKPQQRNFIVEIKSRGRRSTVSPASIWGNTDFKAFARQAESDAPQLFAPFIGAGADDESREFLQVPIANESEIVPPAPAIGHLDEPMAAPMPDDEASKPSEQPESNDLVTDVEAATIGSTSAKLQDRSLEIGAENVVVATSEPTTHVVSASAEFTDDDLSSLESGNRCLRKMLAERLRDQNTQLRLMLGRFDLH
jgi:hypothetical protein